MLLTLGFLFFIRSFVLDARARRAVVPVLTREQQVLKARARINFMIELETRWRLRQLGVPYTEEMLSRFAPSDMASEHRMQIETEHNREQNEREKVERERMRAEELAARQAANAGSQ